MCKCIHIYTYLLCRCMNIRVHIHFGIYENLSLRRCHASSWFSVLLTTASRHIASAYIFTVVTWHDTWHDSLTHERHARSWFSMSVHALLMHNSLPTHSLCHTWLKSHVTWHVAWVSNSNLRWLVSVQAQMNKCVQISRILIIYSSDSVDVGWLQLVGS